MQAIVGIEIALLIDSTVCMMSDSIPVKSLDGSESNSMTNKSITTGVSVAADTGHEVFSFGVERFSDITVHYRSASFHMHQYVLVIASKYFNALLTENEDQDHKCMLSDRCTKESRRRCVELPGKQIGGIDISVSELNELFRNLYADQVSTWRDEFVSGRNNNRWPTRYYIAQVISVDLPTDTVTIDSYEIDGVHRYVVQGLAYVCGNELIQTVSGMKFFHDSLCQLDNDKSHHLADYFQCSSMMASYEKHSLVNAEAISKASFSCYVHLWKILLLSDRYGWSQTRKFCLEACSKHKSCHKMEQWESIVASLQKSTLAELFILRD